MGFSNTQYKRMKEQGRCVNCGTYEVFRVSRCNNCYGIYRRAKLRYYWRNKERLDNERKEQQKRYLANGWCVNCQNPRVSKLYCFKCLSKHNARGRERKKRTRYAEKNNPLLLLLNNNEMFK